MNNVCLTGRIVRDLTLRDGRTPSVKFAIACNDGKDKDNNDIVSYPSIVAFGKLAESLCRWQGKGSQIAVVGRLVTGSYKDKDGKTIYTTDVFANRIDFLSKNPDEIARREKPIEEKFEPVQGEFSFDSDDVVPF